jgi:hypothetical protein
MTEDQIKQQRKAYAGLVQGMKDNGTWNVIKDLMYPGPNGPLRKSDLERIWAEEAALPLPAGEEE